MRAFIERPKPSTSVKVFQAFVPQIEIHPEALAKMQIFVDNVAKEVGWLGTAYPTNHGTLLIRDAFLFDQEVHATTTEITPEGLSDFAQEVLLQPDGVEIWNNLKLWGHSHVNMSVSPSGQDDSQMETFAEGGHDWFIRLIANKMGDMKIDLYNYKTGTIYLDLPWYEAEDEESARINQQINDLYKQLDALKAGVLQSFEEPLRQEIKAKVREKTYTYNNGYGQYKGGLHTTASVPGQVGFQTSAKEVMPSPTSTTSTTGAGSGKADVKKNEASTDEDDASLAVVRWYTPDLADCIFTYDDLNDYFYHNDLVEFGNCESEMEMLVALEERGYGDFFSNNDIKRIYELSYRYCKDHDLVAEES